MFLYFFLSLPFPSNLTSLGFSYFLCSKKFFSFSSSFFSSTFLYSHPFPPSSSTPRLDVKKGKKEGRKILFHFIPFPFNLISLGFSSLISFAPANSFLSPLLSFTFFHFLLLPLFFLRLDMEKGREENSTRIRLEFHHQVSALVRSSPRILSSSLTLHCGSHHW